MDRKAVAQWEGSLRDGKGNLTTDSGVLSSSPYSFATRFENAKGTNPEELVAAAHSGCFSMAVSAELTGMGITPKRIKTQATVTIDKDKDGPGFSVTKSHLDVVIEAPGADKAKVQKAAEGAKANCPISKLLKAEITMQARYEV
jgi:osmotically inducible protein OsmC